MINGWIVNAIQEKIQGIDNFKTQSPGMIIESDAQVHNLTVVSPQLEVKKVEVIIENNVGYVKIIDTPSQLNG